MDQLGAVATYDPWIPTETDIRRCPPVQGYRRHSAAAAHLHVDDLVPDERLQEHADEPDQAVLHVAVPDRLTGGHAVGDVQVDKLRRQLHRRRQPAGNQRHTAGHYSPGPAHSAHVTMLNIAADERARANGQLIHQAGSNKVTTVWSEVFVALRGFVITGSYLTLLF